MRHVLQIVTAFLVTVMQMPMETVMLLHRELKHARPQANWQVLTVMTVMSQFIPALPAALLAPTATVTVQLLIRVHPKTCLMIAVPLLAEQAAVRVGQRHVVGILPENVVVQHVELAMAQLTHFVLISHQVLKIPKVQIPVQRPTTDVMVLGNVRIQKKLSILAART